MAATKIIATISSVYMIVVFYIVFLKQVSNYAQKLKHQYVSPK